MENIVAARFGIMLLLLQPWRSRSFVFTVSRVGLDHGRRQIQRQRTCKDKTPGVRCFSPLTSTVLPESKPKQFHFEYVLDIQVPEGRCIGVSLLPTLTPGDDLDALEAVQSDDARSSNDVLSVPSLLNENHWLCDWLHRDELAYAVTKHGESRQSFVLGRLAMRHALSTWTQTQGGRNSDIVSCSILKDDYGRPIVPDGFFGSISHKNNFGVALVTHYAQTKATGEATFGIGVDVEEAAPKNQRSIARRVLTLNEQTKLGQIPNVTSEEEVLLRFSLKESLYKALHPLICQYVGFREAEVQPLADGSCNVTCDFKSGAHSRFSTIDAHWTRQGDYFLSTASVRLKDEP